MAKAAFIVILLGAFAISGAVAYFGSIPSDRDIRLIQERDIEAANSLRSFRAHERLQQVIPEYRPASKPSPGQRDA